MEIGKLEKGKYLGWGSSGRVNLVHSSGGTYAVKSAVESNPAAFESVEKEARVLINLVGARNVIQCFGEDRSLERKGSTYNLFLEYAPLGNLGEFLVKNGPMSELKVACYASMILTGVEEIHSRKLVHCDLKSENILVFPGRTEDIKTLKVADLGLARIVSEAGLYNDVPTWRSYLNLGTPCTSSPESILTDFHDYCTDIWSFECIFYEMMTGKSPWILNENISKDSDVDDDQIGYLYAQILMHPIKFPKNISPEGVNFLKCCLDRDLYRRKKSAKELLMHPFLIKNKFWIDLVTDGGLLSKKTMPWISTRDLFSTRPMDNVASCYQQNLAINTNVSLIC